MFCGSFFNLTQTWPKRTEPPRRFWQGARLLSPSFPSGGARSTAGSGGNGSPMDLVRETLTGLPPCGYRPAPAPPPRGRKRSGGAEHAFKAWTSKFHLWWPLATHSVSRAEASSVQLEPGVGGRIVERIRGASGLRDSGVRPSAARSSARRLGMVRQTKSEAARGREDVQASRHAR
jgi:hypothetical protein